MLSTNQTLLRAPIPEDREFLLRLRNDIQLQETLMTRARPNDVRKVEEWIARRLNDECSLFFIIADKSSNIPVGFIQLIKLDFINGIGELGICIDEPFHGKGYASDAMELLQNYANNVFNIRKIVLQVILKNVKAIRFYQRHGYKNVGILKEHFYFNNKYEDVLMMEKMLK